jgi:hypothetical protein
MTERISKMIGGGGKVFCHDLIISPGKRENGAQARMDILPNSFHDFMPVTPTS